jgi:UDP-N-acetylglucosamine diphosphorylase/glucosamine-1-phosphate N-acetyltransferase
MNYILFDSHERAHLLPLTFMRPVAEIRCGILKISEKWQKYLGTDVSFFTASWLRKKFPIQTDGTSVFINGSFFPDIQLVEALGQLKVGQALITPDRSQLISFCCSSDFFNTPEVFNIDIITIEQLADFEFIQYEQKFMQISRPWHVFSLNDQALREDFLLLTEGRQSAIISESNRIAGSENIFLEEGAVAEFSVINATTGPVYIGKNAEVMENCAIRGPFALCHDSALKMGAKIYGATTIGPYCKVGGEVNNSVFFGYSNKAHDGFLGNAVIAEWCNLGADTNNSNLKNTYDMVKIWSYPEQRFVSTGLQFCGLIMGDHSKTAINTMFNTGTVVGVSSNIFGEGFPRNFIPSFSWGGASGFKKYDYQKAVEVARIVCKRRNVILSDADIEIFETLYRLTV